MILAPFQPAANASRVAALAQALTAQVVQHPTAGPWLMPIGVRRR